jgi:hypothetical protein
MAEVEKALDESIINPNPVIAAAATGLTPISPVIAVDPVVDIPDFARITKLPADPRLTVAGPAASRGAVPTRPSIKVATNTPIEALLNFFIMLLESNYF